MFRAETQRVDSSSMPRSTASASAQLRPLVYSGNGCVEMRMPATSYPAALTASRTWLRNVTVSVICAGYDFASMVTKPVIARTFGFTCSAPRTAGPNAAAGRSLQRGGAADGRRQSSPSTMRKSLSAAEIEDARRVAIFRTVVGGDRLCETLEFDDRRPLFETPIRPA